MKAAKIIVSALLTAILIASFSQVGAVNEATPGISINIDGNSAGSTADSVRLLLLFTVIAIVPSILIMMTGFTRIIIVFSFLRNAMGLQQTPPNQILAGLAMFLTLFLMSPVISEINTTAYQPYVGGELTQEQALKEAIKPLRTFMLKQTNKEDLNMFLDLSGEGQPERLDSIKTTTIIPAFITSELKRAFVIGFLIYLPFLIIDMVVASVLMSMGMVMLPPVMISLPFKVMLFVLVDGWDLLVKSLILSFNL
jgi:flagellar biosynthetic protein FliP